MQISRREQKSAAIIHKALLTISTEESQYMSSKAPISQISLLGNLLSDAVHNSHHWKMERSLGEPTTDCLSTMIFKDPTQDISINLWVGPERGDQMTNVFKLGPTLVIFTEPSMTLTLNRTGTRFFPSSVVLVSSMVAVVRCIGIVDRDQCTSAYDQYEEAKRAVDRKIKAREVMKERDWFVEDVVDILEGVYFRILRQR